MNRIWISRDSSIPVREQISTQIQFGILSGRIEPAARLPSVRDLARRVKVHANTVSAAYQDLAARGWVKRKAGSGVFVCDVHRAGRDGVDRLAHAWIEEGLSRGFPLDAICAAFEKAQDEVRVHGERRRMLVVHSDPNLAEILAAEIEEAIKLPVSSGGLEDAAKLPEFETFLVLTTASASAAVSRLTPERHQLVPLKSIEEFIAGVGRPSSPVLIGIVSRSESILKWASMLIPALGLKGSDLIHRNPQHPRWRQGLAGCDVVVADLLAARELAKTIHPIVLRLIPESFLRKLVTAEKA
jgi:DNA-binding transcriptional regulator YhcF (GntR family)